MRAPRESGRTSITGRPAADARISTDETDELRRPAHRACSASNTTATRSRPGHRFERRHGFGSPCAYVPDAPIVRPGVRYVLAKHPPHRENFSTSPGASAMRVSSRSHAAPSWLRCDAVSRACTRPLRIAFASGTPITSPKVRGKRFLEIRREAAGEFFPIDGANSASPAISTLPGAMPSPLRRNNIDSKLPGVADTRRSLASGAGPDFQSLAFDGDSQREIDSTQLHLHAAAFERGEPGLRIRDRAKARD